MKSFSLFLPTRERPELLKACVDTFFCLAKNPEHVEMVIVMDDDDQSYAEFEEFAKRSYFDLKILKVPRSVHHQRDYNNVAASQTIGRYIWGLNDDTEMVTRNWDEILENAIEDHLTSINSRIAYIGMDDSTHTEVGNSETHPEWNGKNLAQEYGCCFPILTREAYEKLGFFCPNEIDMWGADIALYRIFQQRPQALLRVPNVKVLHKTYHIGTRPADKVCEVVKNVSKVTAISPELIASYAQRLDIRPQ